MADRLKLAVLVDASASFAGSVETRERLLRVLRETDVAPGVVGVSDSSLERWTVDDAMPAAAQPGGWQHYRASTVAVQLRPALASQPWFEATGVTQTLILPYLHDLSDRSQARTPGWTPDEWLQYLMDGFDRLDEEARDKEPPDGSDQDAASVVLILLLHPQFSGRAGAVQALQQFLRYVAERDGVRWRSPLQLAEEVRACL